MKAQRLLFILAVAALLPRPAHSAPFESWQAHDLDLSAWRDSLIFAKGKFWIRYSEQGGIWSSEDGQDWAQTRSGPPADGGFAFGNDIFVAPFRIGSGASKDAENWTYIYSSAPLPSYDTGSSLTFGNGTFVMFTGPTGRPKAISSSIDGLRWTNRYQLEAQSQEVVSISFANDRFIASALQVGAELKHYLLQSFDGIDWSVAPPDEAVASSWFESIAFGAGVYVGVGKEAVAFTLNDGFRTVGLWSPGEGFRDVCHGDGKFVAVGDLIAYSEDGIQWTQAAKPKTGTLYKVAYGNGRFLAHGERTTWISTNGINWVATGFAISDVTGLVHANGKFVATGPKKFDLGSGILISTNRGRWEVHDVLPGTNRVTELGYAEGKYLAAAGTKAYTSGNALDWEEIETGFDGEIVALAHFQGRFWGAATNAAGDGLIVEAVPGANWRIAKTVPKMPVVGIAASSDRIVAIAGTNLFQGWIFSSADGTDWTESSELIFRPYSIAFLAGRFMIGGHFAGRAFSQDGVAWTQQADGQESLNVIGHTGGAYIGFHAIGAGTRLLASPDGQSWERRLFTTARPPSLPAATSIQISAGAIGSRRVVLARGNVLYETEPLLPSFRGIAREGAGLRLSFGENWTGEPVVVEASENLLDWNEVPGLGEGNSAVADALGPRKFYRMKAR